MIDAQRVPFSFRMPSGLRWFVLAWIAAEIVALGLVVHLLGFWGAVLLGLSTTVLGIAMLRRLGGEALRNLQRAVAGGRDGALLDGMLAALGALLLILPGFLSNVAGCALASPTVRRTAARVFDGARSEQVQRPRVRRPVPPDVIDLSPEDWRIVDRR